MVQDKFADNDPYIQTQLSLTANNNTASFNAVLAETNQLRGSGVNTSSQALSRTLATPFPTASVAGIGTVGAALGGIGQAGTPSTEPGGGGGGNQCFLGNTQFTLWNSTKHQIDNLRLPFAVLYQQQAHWKNVGALSFDDDNEPIKGEITEVFKSIKYEYLHVTFGDDTADDVVAEHRYFTPSGIYVPIKYLLGKYVIEEKWNELKVKSIDEITVSAGITVYNAHIKGVENYCANKRRVHNLKPLPDTEPFNQ